MRSLERRFKNIVQLNPYWSSYLCFAEAVKGQNFGRRAIAKYFCRLVESDDYSKMDRNQIIRNLVALSASLERITDESTF